MHIHPSSPSSSISEEDAAIKIQAGFRGYRVRKQLKQCNGNLASGQSNQRNANNACVYRNDRSEELNGQRYKSSKQLDKEKCATKIQAGIRGFLVRKKQKVASDAAIKIQAGFRGFRARKQLKSLRE
ncbi:abnormal spindle-like microcephaly-associated protein homolog [Contarinia nasturtii]|uniref:abnormal spindle-like microcephaly-associated protein homolog n=1 Tax=Contarinia nasturtii TaxID=265458 RepID=UPI0012D3939B|nr:abnormal spindle-like microcephaly-associated protein homolog [Contarinia nasturtii]